TSAYGLLVLDTTTVENSYGASLDGSVKVLDANSELDLADSSISNGIVSNLGTVISTGLSAIHSAAIDTSFEFKVTSGTLTIDDVGGAAGDSSIANTGTLEVIGDGTTLGAVKLEIDDTTISSNKLLQTSAYGLLVLDTTTVENSYGASLDGSVKVLDANSELDLADSSISNGIVSNLGTVISTGLSAIHSAAIDTSFEFKVTSGTLTIDDVGGAAGDSSIANTGTLEVIGDGTTLGAVKLEIDDTTISSNKLLQTSAYGLLVLATNTVENHYGASLDGSVKVLDANSELDLADSSISNGIVSNLGTV